MIFRADRVLASTGVLTFEQVLAGEVSDPNAATAALLASASQDAAVNRTLAALLDDGYLAGSTPHWPLGGSRPHIVADVLRLTPKRRRAVGQWPSGQTGDVLIHVLETTVMRNCRRVGQEAAFTRSSRPRNKSELTCSARS